MNFPHDYQATAAAGTLALTRSAKSYARIMGSNQELQMAVVGFKGRGRALIAALNATHGSRLTALCDADRKILAGHDAEESAVSHFF